MELFGAAQTLPAIWFFVVGFFWIGYIVLDGFDLGVGMLMSRLFARNEKERRLLLNTIGPVWDGNEVWLVTAGATTFAAFPLWYASLFSALYIPLTLLLLALIFRAVAIEYRGKKNSDTWISGWNTAMSISSFFIAFLIGVTLATTSIGLPLNANGDRAGNALAWLGLPAILGGLSFVGFALVHAFAFIALKTDGDIRHRARASFVKWLPLGVLPMMIWAGYLQVTTPSAVSLLCFVFSTLSAMLAWIFAKGNREGRAFTAMMGFAAFGMLSIFTAMFPNVLPSTLDSAYNLTVDNASSSPYTLKILTIIGCFGIPILLIYQSWTYWVFRKRLTVHHIPAAHDAVDVAQQPSKKMV